MRDETRRWLLPMAGEAVRQGVDLIAGARRGCVATQINDREIHALMETPTYKSRSREAAEA